MTVDRGEARRKPACSLLPDRGFAAPRFLFTGPRHMDTRAREVIRIGDALFSRKKPVDSLFQEVALNFYPERADFTGRRHERHV
jgi:hypothetical protein